MSAPVAFPDIEKALGPVLQPILGLEERHFGYQRLTPQDVLYELPFVQIVRIGGGISQWVLDNPRLDIDVFAGSRDLAWSLASQARTAVLAIRNLTIADGLVSRVEEMAGFVVRAWDNTDVVRLQATYKAVTKGRAA